MFWLKFDYLQFYHYIASHLYMVENKIREI